jgi:Ca-activated chloride channel family protein
MSTTRKSVWAILGLILATTAALAAVDSMNARHLPVKPVHTAAGDGLVTMSAEAVQDKVLRGGDGRVTVALRLSAARLPIDKDTPLPAADLVIVLDRSGSMQGRKLDNARLAITRLIDRLGPDDRLSLVTYSSSVQTRAGLLPMTAANRERLQAAVMQVTAGGGTNLGGGLGRGIDLMMHTTAAERQRKVILISDGLANQGVIDPQALGRMASAALEDRLSISTVGVGLDFNEMVMTAIADRGAGRYHFLEDPRVFAAVFEKELAASRDVAAGDVSIRIPLDPGVRLIDAGGYPIRLENGAAVVHPGDLLSGQQRSLFLTFQVPTTAEQSIVLGPLQMRYRYDGQPNTIDTGQPMTVACVYDSTAVVASIKKDAWENQVVQEEFSRLKEAVAADIRDGDSTGAKSRIQAYEARQSALNAVIGSARVAQNLETEVTTLRDQVDDTFAGAPAAVAEKKKKMSKVLQYEGYTKRRNKQ